MDEIRKQRVAPLMEKRFGMFIHWGLYAIPARATRSEWIRSVDCVSNEEYQLYFDIFNPTDYDPKRWAKLAKAAGMKYAVLTAKHHDGFCLFDSKLTDYKSTNTPIGKDLVKEYVEAFRAEGIMVGLYYSLLDWHHPDFTIDAIHPRRYDKDAREQNEGRDMKRYAQYMRDQVTELLTNYGKIDILWFDFSYTNKDPKFPEWMEGKGRNDWESEKLIALARELQPGIIIDNRSDLEQDLWTPEQYQMLEWVKHPESGELVTWEACQTFSGSWGYFRDEQTWKTPKMLIEMLINTVCIGGNLLMNVGPTARGYLDYRAENALKVYADWMKYNGRSIYNCTMAEPEFKAPRGTRLTQSEDGKRLYIHLIEYPYAFLEFENLADKIDYAQFLNDGSEVLYTKGGVDHFSEARSQKEGLVAFKIPAIQPNTLVPVIEVFLK